MNEQIGGAQLGWKACSIFQPTSKLEATSGNIRHPEPGHAGPAVEVASVPEKC